MNRVIILSCLALTTVSFGTVCQTSHAQALPDLPLPEKGNTVNMSVQSGSRASLSFGSSTSFGTSASLSATNATSTSATSELKPLAGTVLFSIGAGATAGTTTADIKNLRATGSGDTNVAGSPINVTGNNANFSSGTAALTGVQGTLQLTLDPVGTGFAARTGTIHETYGKDQAGIANGQDGKQLGAAASQVSNASANAMINSNTNVDINTTNFTQTFSQAF